MMGPGWLELPIPIAHVPGPRLPLRDQFKDKGSSVSGTTKLNWSIEGRDYSVVTKFEDLLQ